MFIDPRDQRIAALERKVEALLARVEVLEGENRALHAENAELKARLNQNSTNSSKPPSSDMPGTSRTPKKPPTRRNLGGQRGHKHHKRGLVPPERVNRVVDIVPKRCCSCERRLVGRDASPERHQTVEVPPIAPLVTEFRCHALTCTCGVTTRGELPAEARHVFGERLTAIIGLLSGKYLLLPHNDHRQRGLKPRTDRRWVLGGGMVFDGKKESSAVEVEGEEARGGSTAPGCVRTLLRM